jgi:RNA polymerase sigma factor (TIGR02999 family)
LPDKDEITPLLNLAQNGNRAAESRLIELLYADLRRAACACLRFERPGHTLQPTALVHEVFGRLRGRSKPWNNRTHYIAAALETMRHVLVDYARKHSAQRRGSGAVRVDLEPRTAVSDPWTVLVLDVDRALTRLSTLDERLAAIVKLRYFGGFTDVEIGRILHLSDRTVMREWEVARAWLHGQLAGYRTERGPSRSKPNGGVQDL